MAENIAIKTTDGLIYIGTLIDTTPEPDSFVMNVAMILNGNPNYIMSALNYLTQDLSSKFKNIMVIKKQFVIWYSIREIE